MKAVIFAVSKKGSKAALETADEMIREGICEEAGLQVYIKYESDTMAQSPCVTFFDNGKLEDNVKREFARGDALIFVCAVGIAVRMIAPYIGHKSTDPAVLVIDEGMNYCIPILSGHLGGANELARKLSKMIGTIPVITTASDLAGLTAVDMFAKSLGLKIIDFNKAKDLTAALIDGEDIGVINEEDDFIIFTADDLPKGYVLFSGKEAAEEVNIKKRLRITCRKTARENKDGSRDREEVLDLIPGCLNVGIGCRRGTCEDKIREAVDKCFGLHNLYKEAIRGIYSIDLKSDEDGLLDYCNNEGIPARFYSADRLKRVEGDFCRSDFVEGVTGVDNVCERSALAEGGRLIVKKEAYDGVTVAVAAVLSVR